MAFLTHSQVILLSEPPNAAARIRTASTSFHRLPILSRPKATTQRLSGDGASSAMTRTAPGFYCPPILYRPQDHYAEALWG
jgi:hypothetical protein